MEEEDNSMLQSNRSISQSIPSDSDRLKKTDIKSLNPDLILRSKRNSPEEVFPKSLPLRDSNLFSSPRNSYTKPQSSGKEDKVYLSLQKVGPIKSPASDKSSQPTVIESDEDITGEAITQSLRNQLDNENIAMKDGFMPESNLAPLVRSSLSPAIESDIREDMPQSLQDRLEREKSGYASIRAGSPVFRNTEEASQFNLNPISSPPRSLSARNENLMQEVTKSLQGREEDMPQSLQDRLEREKSSYASIRAGSPVFRNTEEASQFNLNPISSPPRSPSIRNENLMQEVVKSLQRREEDVPTSGERLVKNPNSFQEQSLNIIGPRTDLSHVMADIKSKIVATVVPLDTEPKKKYPFLRFWFWGFFLTLLLFILFVILYSIYQNDPLSAFLFWIMILLFILIVAMMIWTTISYVQVYRAEMRG